MYNDSKKASNNRYLSKFKPISLRVLPEEAERIAEAATAAGLSVHAFIMGAIRSRLDGPQDPDGSASVQLPAGVVQVAEAAADRAGLELSAWISSAVQEQSARDARAAELSELLKQRQNN